MIINGRSKDFDFLREVDKHISGERLKKKLEDGEILLLMEEEKIIGWLRYSYFWDEHPFMNMLFILDGYRGMGHGKKLVQFWEDKMQGKGHNLVLTSTQSNEDAQHFYRKIGYYDMGGFVMPKEPLEIMLIKTM